MCLHSNDVSRSLSLLAYNVCDLFEKYNPKHMVLNRVQISCSDAIHSRGYLAQFMTRAIIWFCFRRCLIAIVLFSSSRTPNFTRQFHLRDQQSEWTIETAHQEPLFYCTQFYRFLYYWCCELNLLTAINSLLPLVLSWMAMNFLVVFMYLLRFHFTIYRMKQIELNDENLWIFLSFTGISDCMHFITSVYSIQTH